MISTRTLAKGAAALEQLFIDEVQLLSLGPVETVGATTLRPATPVGEPVAGLVQSTTLPSPVDGTLVTTYSVKVARTVPLEAGMAVRVVRASADSSLQDLTLLVDVVTRNGLAMLRKGTCSLATRVQQEGKEGIA